MATAQTAADYAARYKAAFETNSLTQGKWHAERDGRQLACAIGVLGDDIDSSSKCPAQIMPRWLAKMVPYFFDKQKEADAFAWGLGFTAELARINGDVPFSVVYDWHANIVCPLGIETAGKLGRDPAPHKALQALHLRALAGETISADEWHPVLKAANTDANAYAYANASTYAYAYAFANSNAEAYAYAYNNVNADADDDAWNRLAVGVTECLKRVEVAA